MPARLLGAPASRVQDSNLLLLFTRQLLFLDELSRRAWFQPDSNRRLRFEGAASSPLDDGTEVPREGLEPSRLLGTDSETGASTDRSAIGVGVAREGVAPPSSGLQPAALLLELSGVERFRRESNPRFRRDGPACRRCTTEPLVAGAGVEPASRAYETRRACRAQPPPS